MEWSFYQGAQPGMQRITRTLLGGGILRDQARDSALKGFADADLAQAKIESERAGVEKTGLEAQLLRDTLRRAEGRDAQVDLGAANMAGVSVPEFSAFREYRRTGQIPSLSGESPEVGPVQSAYQWDDATQGRLSRALAAVALGNVNKEVNAHNVTQAAGELQQQGVNDQSLAAAQDGGIDAVRLLQATLGKNVAYPPQERSSSELTTFTKDLIVAGIDPASQQGQSLIAKRLEKLATHAPPVQVNMPSATHYGTDPKSGAPGMFQIGRTGDVQFTPINPPPPSDPSKALLFDIAKEVRARMGGAPTAARPGQVVTVPAEAPRDPSQRKPNAVYQTPKGPMRWTGTGWLPAN
ncbi:MAG: hypothetical protein IT531_00055 [Burkholderiales bacterium]|nr:hypothetical protein [Burkholderiales bacterium]